MQLNEGRNDVNENILNQRPIVQLSVSSVCIGGNLEIFFLIV